MNLATQNKTELKIVADENIPNIKEFFSAIGSVKTYPGRSISVEHVLSADVLLVRSVTKVNQLLLNNSKVKFVGTCTIGTDHLDLEYLNASGITFASAPGSNANSVVEYVFSCLARVKPDWCEASFGIVGCGNVGNRLYRRLKSLGLNCRYYDPLLTPEDLRMVGLSIEDSSDLEEVLQADVVCVHTPLTTSGPYPTKHLIGLEQLKSLRPGTLLLNAGRGPVIDNQSLFTCLSNGQDIKVVLDVWETEPVISHPLMDLIVKATPHIAGYSYDGKVKGVEMIYKALCQYLQQPITQSSRSILESVNTSEKSILRADSTKNFSIQLNESSIQNALNKAIIAGYDIDTDDTNMRASITPSLNTKDSGTKFDLLRKNYPQRREFSAYCVGFSAQNELTGIQKNLIKSQLQDLGFRV